MTAFIDPRADPDPDAGRPPPRLTEDQDEVEELCQLCREGRLYEVERWIRDGRPLQLPEGRPPGRSRWQSPLEIALEDENHALVLLLLCNGYDPNREHHGPLDLALRARRWDLLDLLLDWGADPQRVDLEDLFGTYQSDLYERFRKLGVDLTAGHELAATLAHHTSNKPLFVYAKRHREENPKVQRELDIALAHHAGEGNEKGVALSLWAGADPHAPACSLRWGCDCGEDEDGKAPPEGETAIERACRNGNVQVLERLDPDPERHDFDALFRTADTAAVVEFLAQFTLPEDTDEVIRRHIWEATFDLGLGRGYGGWGSIRPLRRLFELGVRWEASSKEDIRRVRGWLLQTPDRRFVDVMKLLAKDDHCAPAVLHELGRTKAIRRRMKEVGFIPPASDDTDRHRWHQYRPTRFREVLKKCGIELPKPPPRPLPREFWIGSRRRGKREIRMDREELFERVWSTPVYKLAEQWGLSGTGLRKACKRLKVPTPGRGCWQKVKSGKRVRRTKLPDLPEGEAEEIVVWAPE